MRRNLSRYDRSVLALQLEPLYAAEAKRKQVRSAENRVPQKSAEQERGETRDKLAGTSRDTIRKLVCAQTNCKAIQQQFG